MINNWFDMLGNISGIVAFVISVVNFMYFFVIRKKKLYVRFGKIGVSDNFQNTSLLKVHYSFVNKSQLPISITRIRVVINNEFYDLDTLPRIVEQYTKKQGNEIIDRYTAKSEYTPINLASLGAHSGFFAFVIPQDSLSGSEKALTFQICTNRGKAVQKTFSLNVDTRVN